MSVSSLNDIWISVNIMLACFIYLFIYLKIYFTRVKITQNNLFFSNALESIYNKIQYGYIESKRNLQLKHKQFINLKTY